ncbi:MAG: response regulator [Dehalococcoidia bacterium]
MSKILIAHQDPGIREILRVAFEQAGSNAVVFKDSAAALCALKQRDFDRALVDLLMPGVSGEAASEDSNVEQPQQPGRVLFITGYVVNQVTVGFLVTPDRPSGAHLYALDELVEMVTSKV